MITIVRDALYSIQWPNAETNSLDEMVERLSDVEYLKSYFSANAENLEKSYDITELDAISRTAKEIRELVNDILYHSEGRPNKTLDELFKPLHKNYHYNHPRYHTDYKLYGYDAEWIRVYAVKCETNLYVITGYGIKLVQRMQDDKLLQEELTKLGQATDYIREMGMLD